MKNKKNLYIASAAFTVLVLITIQVFLVRRIILLESRKFDFEYREIIQKGIELLDDNPSYNVFKKPYFLMERQSEILKGKSSSDQWQKDVKLRNTLVNEFTKLLQENKELDRWLVDFLKEGNYETEFTSNYLIREIKLIEPFEDHTVYSNSEDPEWKTKVTKILDRKPQYSWRVFYEGTNFSIDFNYFLDFTGKMRVVFRQVSGLLGLSLLVVMIVVGILLITMRNLLEEKRLSQLKTDFINNMTHELKTPLSTISIATRSIENENILNDRDKVVQTARIISRQNRQLAKQINHLLEISMWERKQFDLDKGFVELQSFFSELVEAFRLECKETNLKVVENYQLKTEEAFIDETQLTIAVHNLLINAVKYNEKDPEITIKVRSDGNLKIQVSDNGIGLSREDSKHIFDKFYRVTTGNIHKVKGLGLGLFYVKHIATAHGGNVDVESRLGKGSTFTINIPIHGKN